MSDDIVGRVRYIVEVDDASLSRLLRTSPALLQQFGQTGRASIGGVEQAANGLAGSLRGVAPAARTAERDMVSLGRNAGASIDSISGGIAKLAGGIAAIAVVKFGIESVKAFRDMDQQMRLVWTNMPGMSKEGFDSMSKDVDAWAQNLRIKGEAAAKIMYGVTSVGFDPTKAMQANGVGTLAAKASVAGDGDALETTRVLTGVVNAYGDANITAKQAADSMFVTVRDGAATFGELAAQIQDVVPTSTAFGVSFQDLNAQVTTLTKQGMSAGESTTALRYMMKELGTDGTKASKTFKDAASVTFPEFIKAGHSVGDAIALIGEKNKTTGKTFFDNFSRVNGAIAATKLAGEGAGYYATELDAQAHSSNAVETAYQKMTSGVDRNLKAAGASWDLFTRRTGAALAPFAKNLAGATEGIAKFGMMPGVAKVTELLVLAGVAAIALSKGETMLASAQASSAAASAARAAAAAAAASATAAEAEVATADARALRALAVAAEQAAVAQMTSARAALAEAEATGITTAAVSAQLAVRAASLQATQAATVATAALAAEERAAALGEAAAPLGALGKARGVLNGGGAGGMAAQLAVMYGAIHVAGAISNTIKDDDVSRQLRAGNRESGMDQNDGFGAKNGASFRTNVYAQKFAHSMLYGIADGQTGYSESLKLGQSTEGLDSALKNRNQMIKDKSDLAGLTAIEKTRGLTHDEGLQRGSILERNSALGAKGGQGSIGAKDLAAEGDALTEKANQATSFGDSWRKAFSMFDKIPELTAGTTEAIAKATEKVTDTGASVAKAKAELEKIKRDPNTAAIGTAQTAVESAQIALDRARSSGKDSRTVSLAEDRLTGAQARLVAAQDKAGGSADTLAKAQDKVTAAIEAQDAAKKAETDAKTPVALGLAELLNRSGKRADFATAQATDLGKLQAAGVSDKGMQELLKTDGQNAGTLHEVANDKGLKDAVKSLNSNFDWASTMAEAVGRASFGMHVTIPDRAQEAAAAAAKEAGSKIATVAVDAFVAGLSGVALDRYNKDAGVSTVTRGDQPSSHTTGPIIGTMNVMGVDAAAAAREVIRAQAVQDRRRQFRT